ncbi:basic amino acid ABC transporter substrate-binding protein [Ammoniphilus sp. CFH 90114]|uniref:basic amino acid ABC transporter substrate-binding protein n=1 Tax=Ammoniphilus sp. CFH 90114 TaxID=2493665 RepID=UPI00100F5D42|nr:basic amino acid ABC transporter substrate-binding protein [Ammoniphilus sp. CFH 90114]RXT06620.1 basic amino acid ABC transporter substrate-binding protein [Ammoniphilus sp. CFH 90114]
MALVVALTIVGCGGKQEASTTPSSDSSQPAKKYIVGTHAEFAPFQFLDKGEIVGFDMDLLDVLMKDSGLEYEVKNVGWDPLFAAIQGKEMDIAISGITINEKRQQTYDFSLPYFESTNMILTKEGSSINSYADLKDKKVGVMNGTTGQAAVEKIQGAESKDIKKFDSNVVAIMEMINGGVEAVVTDNAVVQEYVKNNPDKKLKAIADSEFESEFYGIMYPKGSEVKAKLDESLKKMVENGTYTEIYKKWFGEEPALDGLKAQLK